MQGVEPALDVEGLRAAEFPALDGGIYLNAAAVTPLPERSRRAVEAFNLRRSRILSLRDEVIGETLRAARAAAARLVGAEPEEIALGGNTSFGINVAALSLPVAAGGRVVVSAREFPANVYPWMAAFGERLEIIPVGPGGLPDEPRILERLERGDVSVFALSAVQFSTGWRADLERYGRFCRERGIHFVVDAIQALGQTPLDVRTACVDVLATGAHKWLCSPFGTGFVFVRRELLPGMEPRVVGWTGMAACADFSSLLDYRWEPRRDARRFETATLPVADFAGFTRSLELLEEVGVGRIEEHVLSLQEPLIDWLREHPEVEVVSDLAPSRRSGILCFRPRAVEAVHRDLAAAGVVCALREGAIRVAPHLYNTPAEMERVVEILDGSIRGTCR